MPVIWVIDPYRAGERAQVYALADALAQDYEIKRLHHRPLSISAKLFRRTSLAGIDRSRSSALAAPWPDLVLTSGMANEPVCRWIRRESGGRSRIVHIGRPWTHPRDIDLVITTPQYRLPEHPNVLLNDLTLHPIDADWLGQQAQRWQAHFEGLATPRISLIVGGNSGPYTLGPQAAARLAVQASRQASERGGSLMVSTSARTDPAAVAVLRSGLDVPHSFYAWSAGDNENPYSGILSLADEHIVSADSISMLSETCATAKPVYMFDLGGMGSLDGMGSRDFRPGAVLYAGLMRYVWKPLSRDISLVHQRLLASGRCAWLGEGEVDVSGEKPGSRDLARAVARVRELLAG